MGEQKIYIMEDGKELMLIENEIINNKRYLLLFSKEKEELTVAYEHNNELIYMDEFDDNYEKINETLKNKYESKNII